MKEILQRIEQRATIRQKIIIGALILAGFVAVASGILGWDFYRFEQAVDRNELAIQITRLLFDESIIIDDFLLEPSSEKFAQWEEVSSETRELLQRAQEEFQDESFNSIVRDIDEAHERVAEQFARNVRLHGVGGSPEVIRHPEDEMELSTTKTLLSSLRRAKENSVLLGQRIAKEAEALRVINLIVVYGITVLGLTVLGLGAWRAWHIIVAPLERFIKAVQSTRSGNFTEKVPEDRIDEFGELAREFNDMIERLDASQGELARAKARTEAMLSSIGEGLVAVNLEGDIILMNKEAERLTGWEFADARGKKVARVLPLLDSQGQRVRPEENPALRVLSSGEEIMTDAEDPMWFVRKNRETFPVEVTAAPILLEGELIGGIEIFRDITKQRRVAHMKSEFISITSHQLRTPLTGIQWVLERLFKEEAGLSEKGIEYLRDVHSSAGRLAELVNVLLNVSRIEEGSVAIVPEEIDVVQFINSYIEESEPMRMQKNINIVFDEHPDTLVAVTDKLALRNIVQSLVTNAIEYTPEGGRVEIILEEMKTKYKLTVRDTGIGIPKEDQDKIFKKFSRASNAQTAKPSGTGLGLYIAQEAARLLGGQIKFTSIEGKGTKFFVSLPLESKPLEGKKRFA